MNEQQDALDDLGRVSAEIRAQTADMDNSEWLDRLADRIDNAEGTLSGAVCAQCNRGCDEPEHWKAVCLGCAVDAGIDVEVPDE